MGPYARCLRGARHREQQKNHFRCACFGCSLAPHNACWPASLAPTRFHVRLGEFLLEGLIWLFFATIAEVPPAVFIGLNLNYSFNLMFQTPALIVMTIAATRMHRSLSEFVHSGAVDTYSTRRGCQCIAKKGLKPIFTVPIPPNQVEEAVHKTPEDYSPGNIGQYGDLFSADNQSRYQLLMLNDLENQAVENGTKR